LIEIMVVLVIMGVMATGISLGIDSLRGRDADRALKRLRLVLEATADRAMVRGRPMAIELLCPTAIASRSPRPRRQLAPADRPPGVHRKAPCPAELGLGRSCASTGAARAATSLRLQFGSQAPEYELRVTHTRQAKRASRARPTAM
jgi:general secretion pathway protein H